MSPPNSPTGQPAPPPPGTPRPDGTTTLPYTHQDYDPNGPGMPSIPGLPGIPGVVLDQLGEIVQRTTLGQGLTYRPTSGGATTLANGFTHEQLKTMVDAARPESANQVGEAWTRLGNRMMDFGNALSSTANSSQAQWRGTAGNAARTALTQLAGWSGQTGQGLQFTSTNLRTQSDAASTAQTMPDPVPYEPEVYYRQMLQTNDPAQWAAIAQDAREQYDLHVAAWNEAIDKTNTYAETLRTTDSTMPAFAPPPTFGGGGGIDEPGPRPPGGGVNPPGGGVPPGGGGLPPGGVTPPGFGTPPIGPGPGGRPLVPTPTPPTSTPPTGPGYPGGPRPGGPGYPGGPGQNGPGLPGGPGFPGGPRPGGPGGPGGRPGFGPGAGLGGRPGAGGFGPGGSGGTGAGGAGAGAGAGLRGGPGGLGGPGLGGAGTGVAGEGAAGRGGAGAGAGRGGAGGFPLGGAGAQGEEDKEHKRPSYLVESEDVWGDGTLVAPPVIGEAPPEYYRRDR